MASGAVRICIRVVALVVVLGGTAGAEAQTDDPARWWKDRARMYRRDPWKLGVKVEAWKTRRAAADSALNTCQLTAPEVQEAVHRQLERLDSAYLAYHERLESFTRGPLPPGRTSTEKHRLGLWFRVAPLVSAENADEAEPDTAAGPPAGGPWFRRYFLAYGWTQQLERIGLNARRVEAWLDGERIPLKQAWDLETQAEPGSPGAGTGDTLRLKTPEAFRDQHRALRQKLEALEQVLRLSPPPPLPIGSGATRHAPQTTDTLPAKVPAENTQQAQAYLAAAQQEQLENRYRRRLDSLKNTARKAETEYRQAVRDHKQNFRAEQRRRKQAHKSQKRSQRQEHRSLRKALKHARRAVKRADTDRARRRSRREVARCTRALRELKQQKRRLERTFSRERREAQRKYDQTLRQLDRHRQQTHRTHERARQTLEREYRQALKTRPDNIPK